MLSTCRYLTTTVLKNNFRIPVFSRFSHRAAAALVTGNNPHFVCRWSSTNAGNRVSIPARKSRIPRTISKMPHFSEDALLSAAKYLSLEPETLYTRPCITASTCERYDLGRVMYILHNSGLRTAQEILSGDVVSAKYPSGRLISDVMVLSNGSVVAWGVPEDEVLSTIVPLLKSAEIRPYKAIETEDMDFVESEATPESEIPYPKSTMIGDLIVISGTSPLLDKAAFSSGLARSTKLAALEQSLEKYILSIKGYSERLAGGDVLKLADRDVLRATGQWLQIRGQLNLYSELIETPDLYWSEPELENLYSIVSKQLDIAPRIAILNKKLDYASEFVGIIKTYTSEKASTRLEWMIIILIMVEVVFETFHTFDRVREKVKPSESDKQS